MAWPPIATLDGVNLPAQFSYEPHVPQKRNSVTATHGAVVVQHAPDQLILGEQSIPWTIPIATPLEFKVLWDKYDTATPSAYVFVGYWGESYDVYFTKLAPPKVRGRLFNLSGLFQVISEVSDYDPACWVSPS